MASEISKNQYLKTYSMLIKRTNSTDLDDIFKYIVNSKVKDATKLSYLNSIISLKKIGYEDIKNNIDDIIELRDKLNTQIEQHRNTDNLANPKQKKALSTLSREKLLMFQNKLNENKNKSIKNLEDYILINLMNTYPIRNDLMDIVLTNKKSDVKKMKDKNILYIPTKKNSESYLILNNYKTSKTNGRIILNIEPQITNDIKNLIKDGRKYLFVNSKYEPLTSSAFTHKLNRIFEKEFGIGISSTIIRKLYLSDKYKDILDEMKKDAHIMGHSPQVAQNIYISNQ